MRIAHLDTGREWRGGQRQVALLLEGLARRGHATRLLAPHGPLLERAGTLGIESAAWSARGEWDALAVWSAARDLGAWRPDIVHLHSARAHALGVPAARLSGPCGVVVSRRVDFAVATHPLSRLKYRLPVDRYFCISRGVRDVMLAGGVPERKLALVPSGVPMPDEAAIRARAAAGTPLRAALGLPPGAKLIGTVAALAPHKNHADLLVAAARVVERRPDAHFVWVGEGECRPALERQRAALGLESRVHLLGFRADALELLSQFDLFALSSYLEGLCTSLLDSQALGVPIVATEVGGIPDVVRDGVTGRLVPGRDPAAFAAALVEALERPELPRGWAERARESVLAFRDDAMVEGSLREYARVIEERAGRAR